MPSFGEKSTRNLNQCHPDLFMVMQAVVKKFDCSIITGHRTELEQNLAYDSDASTKRWPDSKHNQKPSIAVDVIPYPFKSEDWADTERFNRMAGYILGVADMLNIQIRWGGDWDRDNDTDDQKFNDLVHFELVL